MAKLNSFLFLVLLLMATAEYVACQIGEPFECVISWNCQDNAACKKDCSTKYPGGRGFCTGNPRACLCTYNCPHPPTPPSH